MLIFVNFCKFFVNFRKFFNRPKTSLILKKFLKSLRKTKTKQVPQTCEILRPKGGYLVAQRKKIVGLKKFWSFIFFLSILFYALGA